MHFADFMQKLDEFESGQIWSFCCGLSGMNNKFETGKLGGYSFFIVPRVRLTASCVIFTQVNVRSNQTS